MCGLAGILDTRGAPLAPGALRAMADALRHRGPDSEGFFEDAVVVHVPAQGTGTGSTSFFAVFTAQNDMGVCWVAWVC